MKWKLSNLLGNLLGILAIALTLLFASPASANAPPPPFMNWFTFTYPSGQQNLQGLQIVDCSTATSCEKPVLLIQYGECRETGCLKSPAVFASRGDRLDCAEDRCLWVGSTLGSFPIDKPQPKDESGKWFRLVGQFSDRLRISPPILKGEKTSFPYSGKWEVQVSSDSITVVENKRDDSFNPLSALEQYRNRMFLSGWLLTILFELVVALVYLWWRKASRQVLSRTLVTIASINLLSYPVVWVFFPCLEPFRSSMERSIGIGSLVVAMLYGLLMHVDSSISSRKIVLNALAFSIGGNMISLFVSFYFRDGWALIPQGIPYRFTLPASEIFAVVYEAWLIKALSRGQLSLTQAGILSLLTNTASALLGVLLFSFTSSL